jgi:hypothetical protein
VSADRLLAAAAVAAILAFGFSAEAGLPWPVVALYAAAVYFGSTRQLPPLPRAVQSVLGLLAVVAAAGTALVTVFARQVPIIPDAPGRVWARILGFGLAGLATVGLFDRKGLGRPRYLVSMTVALLVAAGLGYSRPDFVRQGPRVPLDYLVPSAFAAVALWAWAVAVGGPRPTRRGLLTFFGTAAAIAVFFVVFLPIAQPYVERAVAQALAGGATGLGESTSLGDVASLAQSDRVVLRVWTARPQRLRAFVSDRFDGHAWTATPSGTRTLSPLGPPDPALLAGAGGSFFLLPRRTLAEAEAPGAVETRVVPAVSEGWPLLVPAHAVLVRAPAPWLERSANGVLRVDREPALYGVVSRPQTGSERPARAEAPSTDAPPPAEDLQLPRVDERVRDLASKLAKGAASDRERVERTVAHLRAGYRYTLDVGAFRTSDALAEFLFDKRAGYCEYFATAAVVLMRLQGVPARFVKGFGVGEWNEAAGHYVVRDRDAHAWIEAWLPGEGWVEADPTPPGDFAALHARRPMASLAEWIETWRAGLAQAWALLAAGEWRQLLSRSLSAAGLALEKLVTARAAAAALLVAAVLGAIRYWQRRRRRGGPPTAATEAPLVPPELGALLQRLERHWASAGVARPPARALVEHLERLPASPMTPAALDASRRVVDAYYLAAFAGRPPETDAVARLAAEVAASFAPRRTRSAAGRAAGLSG